MAMPAAEVTSCCSAMPTSKKRSGKRAWKGSSPVGPGMAAVSATIRSSSSAAVEQGPGEGLGVGGRPGAASRGPRPRGGARRGTPPASAPAEPPTAAPAELPTVLLEGDRLGGLDVVQALDVVLFGRGVAPALLGQHVDHDRAVPLGGVGEGLLHQVDVVAVDRAGVADAERLEEGVRRHHLAQGAGHRVHARVGQRSDGGQVAQARPQPLARLRVGRVEPQAGQALREVGDRRGIGATVVVEDDDHRDAASGPGC